jgi:enediyne biosynthesis protein E11
VTAPQPVFADLAAEGDSLDDLVVGLSASQWALPTPAPGWTIAHQIAHLASTAFLAGLSARDPEAFRALMAGLGPDFDANVYAALEPYLAEPPAVLLDRWRAEREAATKALAEVPAGETVPWLVRPLPPTVLASAGIMELFAHGQDIADALGVRREPTDRIRHLAEFAVWTRDFAYLERGLTPPAVPFRFQLTAPSGAIWNFGPADAPQQVTGPAVDFCLLVTRRRHRADLAVVASGADADGWLDIAQAYRGSPGEGRRPGQFAAVTT